MSASTTTKTTTTRGVFIPNRMNKQKRDSKLKRHRISSSPSPFEAHKKGRQGGSPETSPPLMILKLEQFATVSQMNCAWFSKCGVRLSTVL
eukprot:1130331-Pyramimonas_sp.AAC.1